jgi:hypothetical protein
MHTSIIFSDNVNYYSNFLIWIIDPTHLHTNQIIVDMQGQSQDFIIWSRLFINILINCKTGTLDHYANITAEMPESYKAQITPNFEIIVLMYLHVFSKQL